MPSVFSCRDGVASPFFASFGCSTMLSTSMNIAKRCPSCTALPAPPSRGGGTISTWTPAGSAPPASPRKDPVSALHSTVPVEAGVPREEMVREPTTMLEDGNPDGRARRSPARAAAPLARSKTLIIVLVLELNENSMSWAREGRGGRAGGGRGCKVVGSIWLASLHSISAL